MSCNDNMHRNCPASPRPSFLLRADSVNKSRTRGLTIVEIVIAVLIFGVGMIPMVTMFQSGNRDTIKLKNLNIATALARDLIETVRAYPYDLVKPGMELYIYDQPLAGGASPTPGPVSAPPILCDGNATPPISGFAPPGYFDPYLEKFKAKIAIERLSADSGTTADAVGNDPSKITKVAVTVLWKDDTGPSSPEREVTLRTLVSKPAMHHPAVQTDAGTPSVEVQYGN